MKLDVKDMVKRIPGTGDFISVNKDKCNGCGRCLIVCVMSLWRLRDGVASIAEDYQSKCLECAACYSVCDADAINFRYPAGGTGIVYEKG